MKKAVAFLSLYGMKHVIAQGLLLSTFLLLSILTINEVSRDIPTSSTEFISKLVLSITSVLSLVFLGYLIASSVNDKMRDFK